MLVAPGLTLFEEKTGLLWFIFCFFADDPSNYIYVGVFLQRSDWKGQ